jgi:hypothetical protein
MLAATQPLLGRIAHHVSSRSDAATREAAVRLWGIMFHDAQTDELVGGGGVLTPGGGGGC